MRNKLWLKLTALVFAISSLTFLGLHLWRDYIETEDSLEVNSHSVILYGEVARPMFNQCSRPSPLQVDDFWKPAAQDVEKLESTLPQFLATQQLPNRKLLGPRLKEFLNYNKQYAGFLRGRKRIIYINAVGYASTTWLKEASLPCDGGDIAFGTEYDVESGQFSEFHFNGAF